MTNFGPAVALLALSAAVFPPTTNSANTLFGEGPILWWLPIQGLTLGMLTALVAIGMALVYRANRILNFAQGDLGLLPTALAIDLIVFSSLNYFLAFGIGLVASVLIGGIVELAIVRRFFRAPRLILTVATIGLAQLLVVGSLLLPRLWGETPLQSQIGIPITWRHEISGFFFDADYLVAWLVPPIALLGIALFLKFTSVGIATRAAAERSDRASLLGIPVGRLHTITWAIAALLSFIALFARAGVVGLPLGSAVGLTTLLAALAALLLGRMTNLIAVGSSAIALGVLEAQVRWREEVLVGPWTLDVSSDLAWSVLLLVVILVALVVQRRGITRAENNDTSSWSASAEVRAVPRELRHLSEVRWARAATLLAGAALLVAVPHLPGIGGVSDTYKAASILVYAVIIMSITILTGWTGLVSLGQIGFVAIGAAVGAKCAVHWGLGLGVTLVLAGAIGAVVATLLGLPVVRVRGHYLAVVSLAFALATTSYILNPRYAPWLPVESFEPEPFLGIWDWSEGPDGTYYLALAFFAIVLAGVLGIRNSRTGRALIATRDNESAAQAFGISARRSKLTAFALSGSIASMAGAMLVHQSEGYNAGLFPNEENLIVFTAAVIGGLGSLLGAVLGAIFVKGGQWLFTEEPWDQLGPLLTSSVGVLLALMLLPGGLSSALFRLRDNWLRWVAGRRGVVVPSLIADCPPPTSESATTTEQSSDTISEDTAEAVGGSR